MKVACRNGHQKGTATVNSGERAIRKWMELTSDVGGLAQKTG